MATAIVGPGPDHPGGIGRDAVNLSNALMRIQPVDYIHLSPIIPRFLYPLRGRIATAADRSRGKATRWLQSQIDLNPYNPRSWISLIRELRHRTYQDAIVLWWTVAAAPVIFLLCLLMRLRGARITLDIHEVLDPTEATHANIFSLAKAILGYLGRICNVVVHCGEHEVTIRSWPSFSKSKIGLIRLPLYNHFPVFPRAYSRDTLKIKDKRLVLTFGTIRGYKGISTLLAAYELLPPEIREETLLAIVGGVWEGESESILSEISKSAHRNRIVVRAEYVPDSEAGLWFSGADLVVLPYVRGSQSGVIRIACSYGLDCITSSTEDARSLASVYDGIHLVPAGDAKALAGEIERVLRRPVQRHSTTAALTWDQTAVLYAEFLREAKR